MAQRVLTEAERAQLRPTVNPHALELLLNRVEPEDRYGLFAACLLEPPDAEAISRGIPYDLAELLERPARLVPPSAYRRVNGEIRFGDPKLQRLWDAVEPTRSAGGQAQAPPD